VLNTPSGEVRLARGSHRHVAPVLAPPTGLFKALTPAGSRHIPDTPGNHTPALFRQLSRRGHPCYCTTLCGKAIVSSVALCRPLPYGWHSAPSKEDGGTLEGGQMAFPRPHGATP
jgi:hypothetical protein